MPEIKFGMRKRAGHWYVRKQIKGRKIEHPLGKVSEAVARQRAEEIIASLSDGIALDTWAEWIERRDVALKVEQMRVRACRRRPNSTLTLDELSLIALRSNGRCEVSGIAFERQFGNHHPLQPSIDRIEASESYTAANCRIVCLAVNYCMNAWGEKAFLALSLAVAHTQLGIQLGKVSRETMWKRR